MYDEKEKAEINKFMSMLWHDDKNSNYFICHKENGEMSSWRTSKEEFDLSQIHDTDCYISLNGFTGFHRKATQCRQINGFIFDLDHHEPETEAYLTWIKERTLRLIFDAVEAGVLNEPNVVTDTGRGIQLLYLFENSISYRCKGGAENETAVCAYNRIRDKIKTILTEVLSSETDTLDIDNNVFDLSRIVRIPNTINSKTGKKAALLHTNEDYYSFSDFYVKKPKKQTPKKEKKDYSKLGNKDSLNKARVEEMEKLQAIRKDRCEGSRNYMTFIYYNSAIQIYDKETAVSKTYEFCKNFGKCNTPFTDTQIAAIIRGVDNNVTKDFKGHYAVTKEWIIEKLSITDEEAKEIGLDKSMSKRKLKKRENQLKKAERNRIIVDMADAGINHKEIAESVGVSLRTVQTILKNSGKTRAYISIVNVQKNAS